MKRNIWQILIPLLCLWGCSEIGLQENGNDITYLFFTKDVTQDSTVTSFIFYKEDRIEIPLSVETTGRLVSKDIPCKIIVNKEQTTLPESCYELPANPVFRAGRMTDTINITFVNQEILKAGALRLVLELQPTDDYEMGPFIKRKAKMLISDKMEKPDWWTVLDHRGYMNIAESYYLGVYSEKKYGLLLELLDGVVLNGFDKTQLRFYALKLKNYIRNWNEEHYPDVLMDEENNRPMTVPVAG